MDTSSAGWKPAATPLLTRWAAQVSPANVLPEYPRPQLVRPQWLNLNGLWEYAIVPWDQSRVPAFEGQILVPFPVESALSGVKRPLLPGQRLWYKRSFAIPDDWQGQRLLLHFGAVDWKAIVWVNRKPAGTHLGGYDPFPFEITSLLQPGQNELLVAVTDPTDQGVQERGKQALKPAQVFYTAVSGIWQTVWLEPVPPVYIQGLKLTPQVDEECLTLTVQLDGEGEGLAAVAEAFDGDVRVAAAAGVPGGELRLNLRNPVLWSPETPHLYDLVVSLQKGGKALDEVNSYFGMRKFGVGPDKTGRLRLLLNNQPYFHLAPLDQGYWPDGLYTAPSDAALSFDIETCKRLGFNTIRKHVKVEPARWYYHCDRLGMIVWQDMPNGGKASMTWTFLGSSLNLHLSDKVNYGRFGRQDAAARQNYQRELDAMLTALYNCPCIGMWVPFNEGWGQFDSARIASGLHERDRTRPVDAASGFFDNGGGDLKSEHQYLRKLTLPRPDSRRALGLSEIGGYGLLLPEHAWQTSGTFSYSRSKSREELTRKYTALLGSEVQALAQRGLSGVVYTQLTDVEGEINGFLSYDRAVEKMDFKAVRQVHDRLIGAIK